MHERVNCIKLAPSCTYKMYLCFNLLVKFAALILYASSGDGLSLRKSFSESPGLLPRLVYQFPVGEWVENLAIRRNNNILLSLATSPSLYTLDPHRANPHPVLVHTFPSALSLFAIVETASDVFAVIVGNFTVAAGPTPGSFSVWRIDLNGVKIKPHGQLSIAPKVSKTVDIPQAKFLNGMATLSETTGLVLIGDIGAGVVYRLNVHTAQYSIAINNSLTAVASSPVFGIVGVNGIAIRDNELYVANTGQSLIGRVAISANGTPAGPPIIIARALNSSLQFDDFALGPLSHDIFAATGSGNSIVKITPEGKQTIIAGNLNSTQFAEPVSARFGRGQVGENVLYVVTTGGLEVPVDGDERVGGQVIAIRT